MITAPVKRPAGRPKGSKDVDHSKYNKVQRKQPQRNAHFLHKEGMVKTLRDVLSSCNVRWACKTVSAVRNARESGGHKVIVDTIPRTTFEGWFTFSGKHGPKMIPTMNDSFVKGTIGLSAGISFVAVTCEHHVVIQQIVAGIEARSSVKLTLTTGYRPKLPGAEATLDELTQRFTELRTIGAALNTVQARGISLQCSRRMGSSFCAPGATSNGVVEPKQPRTCHQMPNSVCSVAPLLPGPQAWHSPIT